MRLRKVRRVEIFEVSAEDVAGLCPNGHVACLSARCWAIAQSKTPSDAELVRALRHAAKIVQDHVTKSRSAQVALTVRTYRDTLFALRRDLERMAHQIESGMDGGRYGANEG